MLRFIWSDETIEHLARHGVTPAEFEEVLANPTFRGVSHTSDRDYVRGYTSAGRYLGCLYETEDDGLTIIPVTAFDLI